MTRPDVWPDTGSGSKLHERCLPDPVDKTPTGLFMFRRANNDDPVAKWLDDVRLDDVRRSR